MPRVKDARPNVPEARLPAYLLRSDEWADLVKRSPLAAHVWLLLAAHANRQDVAWCSQRRLALLTGSYRRSIVEALGLLASLGWLKAKARRHPENGGRLADEYHLRLPGGLEAARSMVNARLSGKQQQGEIPGFRDDDLFMGASRMFTRMARLPLEILASHEFAALRSKGASVLLTYLLLCVYAPSGERVGGKRLAQEAHLSLPRFREAIATLSDSEDRWIEVVRTKATNGGDRPNSYVVIGRLVRPAVDVERDETPTDDTEQFGVGRPPEDLVRQLPEHMRVAHGFLWTKDEELWDYQWMFLKNEGLWPRPIVESDWDATTRLIRQFHGISRQADTRGYQPTPREHAWVLSLFKQYGADTWKIANYALRVFQRTKFVPTSIKAMEPLVGEAVVALGLKATGQ